MNERAIDKIIMLLSTDWFFDQWLVVGLDIDEEIRRTIQVGCRRIVIEMIGTARDYWHASFSEERVSNTRMMFDKLLAQSEAKFTAISSINALIAPANNQTVDSGTQWALLHLTELIISGSSEANNVELEPRLKRNLSVMWREWEWVETDCEGASVNSASEWDKKVRDLTPDLPSRLCDYLSQEIIGSRKFEIFWAFIQTTLTATQRKELFESYRFLAELLGMGEISIPLGA
jgi:hypothetical protein